MKTLYAASKSHTGADEKRDTNFHWPYGADVLSITTLQVNLNFCRTSTLPNSWEIRFKNKAKKCFIKDITSGFCILQKEILTPLRLFLASKSGRLHSLAAGPRSLFPLSVNNNTCKELVLYGLPLE